MNCGKATTVHSVWWLLILGPDVFCQHIIEFHITKANNFDILRHFEFEGVFLLFCDLTYIDDTLCLVQDNS